MSEETQPKLKPKRKKKTPSRRDPLPQAVAVRMNMIGKIGRPTVYYPEYDEIVYRMRLLGLNDDKLATFFGINVGTLDVWKATKPSFLGAYVRGGDPSDAEVAQAYTRRATGMRLKKQVPVKVRVGQFEEEIRIVEIEEEIPPDTLAAARLLANRRRQEESWRWNPDLAAERGEDNPADAIKIIGGLPED